MPLYINAPELSIDHYNAESAFHSPVSPFGYLMGIAGGVPAYSNYNADHLSQESNWHVLPGKLEPIYSGMKWQCVEYARRYLQIVKNITFDGVDDALAIWSLSQAAEVETGKDISLASFINGEAMREPSIGSLLIYPRGDEAPYGHVAVIVAVDPDFVYIAEQNWTNDPWQGKNYSRKLKIRRDELGRYQIDDSHGLPILGWKTAVSDIENLNVSPHQSEPEDVMNSRSDLSKKNCIPCQGGIPPLKGSPLKELHRQLGNDWKVIDEHHLEKEYSFKNFREALAFTNAVGAIAEEEGHHPDILLSYGKVKIEMWTHKINGLTESDFILAAKIENQWDSYHTREEFSKP